MEEMYDWRPLERERVAALMNQDPGEYARLCYELGIEPEDQDLYKQGALPEYNLNGLEKAVADDIEIRPFNRRKRSVSNETYRKFYDEGILLSKSIFADDDGKRSLLLSYFPNQFGTDGRIPINKFSPRKVGSLFNSFMEQAKKRAEEQSI